MKRKLVKNVRKLRVIINKNRDRIKRIIVSEDFLDKIVQVPKEIIIDSIIEEDTEAEILRLYGVETVLSQFVVGGCILEMIDDSYYIIKI